MTRKYIDIANGDLFALSKMIYNKPTTFNNVFQLIYNIPCKVEDYNVVILLIKMGLDNCGLLQFTRIIRGTNANS